MRLLVGGPVYRTAWCLPAWFEHVFKACRDVDDVEFVFAGDPEVDAETWDAIDEHAGIHTVNPVFLKEAELPGAAPEESEPHRWPQRRLHHMVAVRNEVLAAVREVQPDLFLSLDSDILLHPDAVNNMLETATSTPAGAVGGKAYLHSRSRRVTSYARVSTTGGLDRGDERGVFKVDVLMAVVLMKPAAYNVDYHHDHRGEDIGWSLACKANGVKLWWDARVPNKHLWAPDRLGQIDERCGW